MAAISSVAPTLLQSAVSQVLPSTSVNSSKNLSSPSATVSLGNATPAPLTYNASGQLGASQIGQLEQAINNDVSNTLAGLFSGSLTSGTSANDALLQQLASTTTGVTTSSANTSAAQAQQSLLDAQKLVNDTLSSLFSDSSTDSSSSSDSVSSLLSSYTPTPVSGNS